MAPRAGGGRSGKLSVKLLRILGGIKPKMEIYVPIAFSGFSAFPFLVVVPLISTNLKESLLRLIIGFPRVQPSASRHFAHFHFKLGASVLPPNCIKFALKL